MRHKGSTYGSKAPQQPRKVVRSALEEEKLRMSMMIQLELRMDEAAGVNAGGVGKMPRGSEKCWRGRMRTAGRS